MLKPRYQSCLKLIPATAASTFLHKNCHVIDVQEKEYTGIIILKYSLHYNY